MLVTIFWGEGMKSLPQPRLLHVSHTLTPQESLQPLVSPLAAPRFNGSSDAAKLRAELKPTNPVLNREQFVSSSSPVVCFGS